MEDPHHALLSKARATRCWSLAQESSAWLFPDAMGIQVFTREIVGSNRSSAAHPNPVAAPARSRYCTLAALVDKGKIRCRGWLRRRTSLVFLVRCGKARHLPWVRIAPGNCRSSRKHSERFESAGRALQTTGSSWKASPTGGRYRCGRTNSRSRSDSTSLPQGSPRTVARKETFFHLAPSELGLILHPFQNDLDREEHAMAAKSSSSVDPRVLKSARAAFLQSTGMITLGAVIHGGAPATRSRWLRCRPVC